MNAPDVARLGLGSAQFGMDYGLSNADGRVPVPQVAAILAAAFDAGLRLVDTAPAYGEAETVLGACLPQQGCEVVTKTLAIKKPKVAAEDVKAVADAFAQSRRRLRRASVYGLLVHHADDLLVPGGDRLYAAMREWQAAGAVQKIGVSLYTAAQLDAVMDRYEIGIVQLPLNVADQRRLRDGRLAALRQRGVETHARSVFLQGALLTEPERLPSSFAALRPRLTAFRDACRQAAIAPLDACLHFALRTAGADRIVLGVCSKEQLDAILTSVRRGQGLPDPETLAWPDDRWLDPSQWPSMGMTNGK